MSMENEPDYEKRIEILEIKKLRQTSIKQLN